MHTVDVNERGAPDGADPAGSAGMNPCKRIRNLALVISALGLGALGLVLGFTRPAGERMEGPLGLRFVLLVAATTMLGLVTMVGDKRS